MSGVIAAALAAVVVRVFLFFVAQHGAAREFDFVAFFADTLDHYLLTFLEFVAHVADAAVGNLGNVQQAVETREDFDKRAEINDARNRA